MVLAGDRVTHAALADVLHAGDQVADLPNAEVAGLDRLGTDHADLEHLVDHAGRHHLDPVAVRELAVDHPDVGDHAPVGVVDRVEDQRARRSVRVPDRRRRLEHDLVEQLLHAHAGLGGDLQYVGRVAADDPGQLGGVLLGLCGWQVDLVEHRDDVQVGAQGQVEVRQRLRLDPLRRVDEQYGGLARLERPGHLVGEVDVARGVDHVEHVGVRLGTRVVALLHRPGHPHGLALDGDAALALDVHPVEVLRPRRPLVDHTGQLQHPVCQRRLAVVDVRDDAEVPDDRGIGRAGDGRGCVQGHGLLSNWGRSRTNAILPRRWRPTELSRSERSRPPASYSALSTNSLVLAIAKPQPCSHRGRGRHGDLVGVGEDVEQHRSVVGERLAHGAGDVDRAAPPGCRATRSPRPPSRSRGCAGPCRTPAAPPAPSPASPFPGARCRRRRA